MERNNGLSIGLENPDNPIADITQAMEGVNGLPVRRS